MSLESADYISQLVTTNPVGAVDSVDQGDDHIRLLKHVLQTQFPNLSTTAVTVLATELNRLTGVTANVEEMRGMAFTTQAASYVVAQGDIGKALNVTGSGTVTLGNLTSGFACLIFAESGTLTITSTNGVLKWYYGGGAAPPEGNRTLARGGVVTVYRDGTNWRVFGAGLS